MLPRSDTNIYSMLEYFAEFGAQSEQQAITIVCNIAWRGSKSAAMKMLKNALAQEYLVMKNGKYALNPELEATLIHQMEKKRKTKIRQLVAAPYRNVWTPEMTGYTSSLYRNKRGYEGKYDT